VGKKQIELRAALYTPKHEAPAGEGVLLHLALCNIASADPGASSAQSLAHEMALIARQAIERYLGTTLEKPADGVGGEAAK